MATQTVRDKARRNAETATKKSTVIMATQTVRDKARRNAETATKKSTDGPTPTASSATTPGTAKPQPLEYTLQRAKVAWEGVESLSVNLRQAGTQWDAAIKAIIDDSKRGEAALAFFAVCQEATNLRRQALALDPKDSDQAAESYRSVWKQYAGDDCMLHTMNADGEIKRVQPRTMAQSVQAILETHGGYDIRKVANLDSLRRTIKSATDALRYAARGFARAAGYKVPELITVTPRDQAAVSNNRIYYKGTDGTYSLLAPRSVKTAQILIDNFGGAVNIQGLVVNMLAHFNLDVRMAIWEDVKELPKDAKEAIEVVKADEGSENTEEARKAVAAAMGKVA